MVASFRTHLLLPLLSLTLLQARIPAALAQRGEPLLRAVELDVGEAHRVQLHDGSTAAVRLLDVDVQHDAVGAVRDAQVTVEVNGERTLLHCGNYNLPRAVGGAQVDCPAVKAYLATAESNGWGIGKDARLRLWPAGSPFIRPGTFIYPLKQRWLASESQYSNEPSGGRPNGRFYYHTGLDFGGAEGLVEVVSATDGVVATLGAEVLPGTPAAAVSPRSDVVYVRDGQGWYYRYSHLNSIEPGLKVGQRVKMGQPIGRLGKEGGSGGWSHLHFEVMSLQPSGEWGTQDAYAFIWQAYREERDPEVLAIARPHRVARAGEPVLLDATRSWARRPIRRYRWIFGDSVVAEGPVVTRTYSKPGVYTETLEVTDEAGAVDYDFARVEVFQPLWIGSMSRRGSQPSESDVPGIHAAFHPTRDIEPGEEITFKVRARGTSEGFDVIDYGDGSPRDTLHSNRNPAFHAPDGYAAVTHRYARPGHYVVSVWRENRYGRATTRLHVAVGVEE